MSENLIVLDDKKKVNFDYAAELNNSLNAIAFRLVRQATVNELILSYYDKLTRTR